MGREVKRVPLDFEHPLKETWPGFLNPHYRECPDCENGYTVAGKALDDFVNSLMWNRMNDLEMRALTVGLAGRDLGGHHDSIDSYSASKAIVKAAGLDEKWGICKRCDGNACHPDAQVAWEAWEPTGPPTGEGWQMWETTSEGSPISPVCKSPEVLALWLEENNASTFGRDTATYDQWLNMIRSGWAPSAIFTPGVGLQSGVAATPLVSESE